MPDPEPLTNADFIGWGRLQERMFEPFGVTAQTVVDNLLEQADARFTDLDEPVKRRATAAFVFYFAWQGLADGRDLIPATERQGGRTDQYSESQLLLYRTKAAAARGLLEPYMPELSGEGGEYDFGPLYGGSELPAAFRRYGWTDPLESRGSARPAD